MSQKRGFKLPRNIEKMDSLIRLGMRYPKTPGLVCSPVPLAPAATRTVLRYSARTTVNCNLGFLNSQVFSGNSVFDPDVTGTGNQPVGHDQWSALYTRYRVLASAVRVAACTPAATTNASSLINLVVTPMNLANALSNADAGAAQPYAKRAVFNGFYPQGLSSSPAQIYHQMTTAQMQGHNAEAVIADDENSATTAANPAQMWYWHILVEPVDRATSTNVTLEITIDYLVDYYEVQVASISSYLSSAFLKHQLKTIEMQKSSGDKRSPPTNHDPDDKQALELAVLQARGGSGV